MRDLTKFAGMAAALVAGQVALVPVVGQWEVYGAIYAAITVGASALAALFLWMHMVSRAPFTLGLFFTFFGIAWIQGFWMANRALGGALTDPTWFWLLYVGTSLSFTGIWRHSHDFYVRSQSRLRWVFFGIPILSALVGILMLAIPAHAGPGCRAWLTPDMHTFLAEHGQVPVMRGIIGDPENPEMAEIWWNPATQSWSLIISDAGGVSCRLAWGESLHIVEPPKQGEEG